MSRHHPITVVLIGVLGAWATGSSAAPITTVGQPAQLDICAAGAHGLRITLKPHHPSRAGFPTHRRWPTVTTPIP